MLCWVSLLGSNRLVRLKKKSIYKLYLIVDGCMSPRQVIRLHFKIRHVTECIQRISSRQFHAATVTTACDQAVPQDEACH